MNIEDKKDIINHISKLQWACRRGMLELDVLLGNFLKEVYSELALADQFLFVSLLSHKDPEIFAWLMGYDLPGDPEIAKITTMIRQHARSRVHA